ncbi:MAG: (2Fe-2S)-binding protein [Endomicrobiia bacterium]|nr:(2Fe-2S)-binding protein [Endomicrobiia bacterium]
MKIKFELNGNPAEWEIKPGEVLLDTLRRLGLKGAKEGCRQGECGCCTVLLDGKPINSCLLVTALVAGRKLLTIEGVTPPKKKDLSHKKELHPIQQAYLESGAVQCGYCTPGMVLSTKALLDKNPSPTEEEIKKALEGVLCRCTGYSKIIDAVKLSAEKLSDGK